jgi:DNA mismatch repair ATPase MutS
MMHAFRIGLRDQERPDAQTDFRRNAEPVTAIAGAGLAKGSPPLLFLLDEFLQGTNSHDRRLGAEGVLRTLLDYGAIGLITTHDLALAEIADRLAPRAANVHFEDHFVDGALAFDYRMRSGVVTTRNALALMRAVGIEV